MDNTVVLSALVSIILLAFEDSLRKLINLKKKII